MLRLCSRNLTLVGSCVGLSLMVTLSGCGEGDSEGGALGDSTGGATNDQSGAGGVSTGGTGHSDGGSGGSAADGGATGSGGGGEIEVTDPTATCADGKAAFPGAQGPGACAQGGRGGDVYHVTNLSDDASNPAPGSLRYGLANVPDGGRTIVFDVAGTIRLGPAGRQGWLSTSASNVTIAGQTAPEPGITIMGQATKLTGENVVLRHIKFRPGQDQKSPGVATNDGVWVTGQNIIVDHVSASWADDELLSVSDQAEDVTLQYALLSNALNYGGHSMGQIVGSDIADSKVASHHSLFAHSRTRNPRFGSEVADSIGEFSNNVLYNWGFHCGYAGADQPYRANMRNNYYIAGPQTDQNRTTYVFLAAGTAGKIYFDGNVGDMNKNGEIDGSPIGTQYVKDAFTAASTPFAVDLPELDSAEVALEKVLSQAGAFFWARDSVDEQAVDHVKNGTGSIPAMPDASQWNELWNATTPIERPADFDTDGDGMPNAWEDAHGFDPNDANDGKQLVDGYTNLERYLNVAAMGGGYP